ncbi:MAG: hypothetical protein M3Z66_15715 [Chloroflexota bacterium]|nr:hypothetical protein [Chloroflexota bacterium]
MADFPTGQERLLKKLISTYRCSVCRRGFEQDHVRITSRQEQLWIVSVRCGRCRNQQVFWVALKEDGEQAVLRDLSEAEEERFAEMAPVGADDVLDIHEFLRDFNGDFRALFRS